MKKKIIKFIVGCSIVGVVSAGGYFGYKSYASKSTVTSNRIITNKVKKGNIDITVQATGTITSVNEVSVSSSNSGTIKNLSFKAGDPVKKGDVICNIDDSNAQQSVASAQNSLAQKNLELSNLEKSLDDLYIKAPIDGKVKSIFVSSGDNVKTAKQAYGALAIIVVNDSLEVQVPFPDSGKIETVYISPGAEVKKGEKMFKLDGETIQNNINAKKLEIQQAQSDLSFKQSSLSKTTITSSIDGVISTLNVKEGDTIDSNNKAIATITDLTQMQVILPVDELDIDKVKVGQKATIGVDSIKDKTYDGVVEKIAQTGKTTNNVTTFDVTVSVSNPERIKPGMNANVTIAIESKENVLTIPVEALIDRNGKHFVMVPSSDGTSKQANSSQSQKTGQATNSAGNNGNSKNSRSGNSAGYGNNAAGKLIQVTVGLQNQNQAEIVEGLKEGDSVLITLPQTSSNNTRINFGGGNNFGGGGAVRSSSGGRGN
ncbi:biotin/lipoyl-binding protein [Clostridium sp. DJ247]|uniref:efflux RND transporter periplasmic adaptor subunit n=1 Tax=Clostridium sp. DJ247 TaxID=2726188 RepID=UPI00162AB8C4|nr:biotin/lipoyl-binding protein [Clostridium sp. DJ247]MBC2581651.1 biotin/lipoyl-binding protein [Clostridium sp. DJ247]